MDRLKPAHIEVHHETSNSPPLQWKLTHWNWTFLIPSKIQQLPYLLPGSLAVVDMSAGLTATSEQSESFLVLTGGGVM